MEGVTSFKLLTAREATGCPTKMASSCSTSLLTPSFPIQFFPYVPPAHKPKPNPKPKSKAISTATAKIAGQNRSGISSSKDDGDWLHIDNFPTPDSNASLPALFGAATSDSEKLENYQPVRESLDGKGTVVDGLFDGSSLGKYVSGCSSNLLICNRTSFTFRERPSRKAAQYDASKA